jgi:hypothetical protein
MDLGCGKSFNMQVWKLTMQAPHHVKVIRKRLFRMQGADHVNFSYTRTGGTHALNCFLLIHAIRARIMRITAERTQRAAGRTNVGKIEMAVHVKEDPLTAMASLNGMCGSAQSDNIIGDKQAQAVIL